MFYTLFTIALFAALAIQRSPAAVTIDTPNITQCEAFQITWSGAIDPVNIIIVSAANPCGQPLADLGDHNGTSTTSNTTITPGSVIQLSLLDADDNEAWSGDITVLPNPNASCSSKSSSSTTHTSTTSTSTGSTLTIPSTLTVGVPSSSQSPVGAAGNAGANPLSKNNSITVHQSSMPIMVLATLAAVVATFL